jgi:hypothetical protein
MGRAPLAAAVWTAVPAVQTKQENYQNRDQWSRGPIYETTGSYRRKQHKILGARRSHNLTAIYPDRAT